ncbi:MAG: hypothetical protein U1E85_08705 [Rhodocyclaceae bacterium]
MSSIAPMAMDERKIIARRAAFELMANSVVNLGIGMPEGVSSVAAEEKVIDLLTLTAEPGVVGGVRNLGAQFRRRGQHRRHHRPTYQFDYRRWRSRRYLPRTRAQARRGGNLGISSSGRGQPAPAASSTSARTRRRSSSSAPSPQATSQSPSRTAS